MGLSYGQMLIFDDEPHNICEDGRLGVRAVHMQEGVTWEVFNQAAGHAAGSL